MSQVGEIGSLRFAEVGDEVQDLLEQLSRYTPCSDEGKQILGRLCQVFAGGIQAAFDDEGEYIYLPDPEIAGGASGSSTGLLGDEVDVLSVTNGFCGGSFFEIGAGIDVRVSGR